MGEYTGLVEVAVMAVVMRWFFDGYDVRIAWAAFLCFVFTDSTSICRNLAICRDVYHWVWDGQLGASGAYTWRSMTVDSDKYIR